MNHLDLPELLFILKSFCTTKWHFLTEKCFSALLCIKSESEVFVKGTFHP